MEQPSEFQGRIREGKDWREIVAWVSDLPPMPQVASRAMTLLENPDTTAQELNELLSKDAALAARVLKIANSAMFSRQREITTLPQAIMIIGFKALKGVIVAATLRQMNKSFGRLDTLIWENSVGTAVASTLVTRFLKRRYVEEIFLLGLLHSLGQVVLLAQPTTAKEYLNVIKLIREKSLDYVSAENEVFGFAHPLMGALVAKKWNFNPETCQVILHYRDDLPALGAENEQEEKGLVVRFADLLAHRAGIGHPEGYPSGDEELTKIASLLQFPAADIPTRLDDFTKKTKELFEAERAVYG